MEYTYEVIVTDSGIENIVRTDENGDKVWIPKDPGNADYQRYLNPDAEQSTPSLTDEAEAK
jgi:hypothetical protein